MAGSLSQSFLTKIKSSLQEIRVPKYQHWILPFAIFFLAVAARLIPGPRIIDYAYITFRYARNILAESGFVYNPGEQVLDTTTPLYTLLPVSFGKLVYAIPPDLIIDHRPDYNVDLCS